MTCLRVSIWEELPGIRSRSLRDSVGSIPVPERPYISRLGRQFCAWAHLVVGHRFAVILMTIYFQMTQVLCWKRSADEVSTLLLVAATFPFKTCYYIFKIGCASNEWCWNVVCVTLTGDYCVIPHNG